MKRPLSILLSPEAVLVLITAAVFWCCAHLPSGAGRDVEVLGRVVMFLPVLVVPVVFATVLAPGAKTWWRLGRAVIFTFVALAVCAWRIIEEFGAGPKGQDGAFIMMLVFALVMVSLGTAITGAMILGDTRPAFAAWFRARRVIGTLLTLLAALPIGFVLSIVVTWSLALVLGLWVEFTR
jgi:hypothetical protein